MNRLLKECALDETCAYLPDRKQTTHYKIIDGCSDAYCETLIERGWRRFGNMFFRPLCCGCEACESVKIDAQNYAFSKSARRVIRKNSRLRTLMQRPTLTEAHLELFREYHDHMEVRRGWENQPVNARNYYMSFVQGHNSFGYEILYYDDERLVAVDLIDLLPNGISSIYFYYHPDYAGDSLGRYSLYRQIMYARANGLKWIYLGYYVQGCQSLAYKSSYKPLYMLDGKPHDAERACWRLTEA